MTYRVNCYALLCSKVIHLLKIAHINFGRKFSHGVKKKQSFGVKKKEFNSMLNMLVKESFATECSKFYYINIIANLFCIYRMFIM